MKKRIISTAFLAVVVTVITWNINESKVTLPDLVLENIEALAAEEVQGGGSTKNTCYKTITTKEGCQVRYCQTCSFVSGTYSWASGTGSC